MKYTAILFLSFMIGACSTSGKSTLNNVEVDGDVLSVVVDSKDFTEMKKTLAAESAREKCFEYNSISGESDIVSVASIVARAAGKGIDCGTSHNDTVIAGINAKVENHKTWAGVIGGVTGNIPLLGGAYVLGKALDKNSTEVNVDNGSTATGAFGEGNTYTAEQVSGILTEPAPVNPITINSPTEEDPIACVEVRALIPISPGSNEDANGCFDENNDGFVCSTGGGCVDS